MSRPLRMGYIVRMFPRFSETFVLQEILELERQGVEVTIFSLEKPNEGRFHPALSRLRAPVIYLDDREARKWPAWLPAEWTALGADRHNLWRLVEETMLARGGAEVDLVFHGAFLAARSRLLELDALHAHFATTACTLAHYAHGITGIPYSFTAHAKDIFTESVDRDFLTGKINSARFVVTVSEFNRRFLLENQSHADLTRVRVLYNGVDLKFFSLDQRTVPESEPTILGVGRLVAKKGFADLVRASALLKDSGIKHRCVIVGQGREEAGLRSLADSLGVTDAIEFAGPRHQEEVRNQMREATVLCLPCLRDNDGNQDALPTVLLEAMACGLPVVSTRLSGIPEIVDDGQDGILVDQGAPAQLADALARILSDAELRRRFSEAGRRKIEDRFDIQKNVSLLHEWFAESDRQMSYDDRARSSSLGAPSTAGVPRGMI